MARQIAGRLKIERDAYAVDVEKGGGTTVKFTVERGRQESLSCRGTSAVPRLYFHK
ncbi:MAG: hypothetical protein HYY16_09350 [Planctomycetes bacterium]|nr:hypothetical protein [Planctomycetota bacterium]